MVLDGGCSVNVLDGLAAIGVSVARPTDAGT
jgi:hypothetical protein